MNLKDIQSVLEEDSKQDKVLNNVSLSSYYYYYHIILNYESTRYSTSVYCYFLPLYIYSRSRLQ